MKLLFSIFFFCCLLPAWGAETQQASAEHSQGSNVTTFRFLGVPLVQIEQRKTPTARPVESTPRISGTRNETAEPATKLLQLPIDPTALDPSLRVLANGLNSTPGNPGNLASIRSGTGAFNNFLGQNLFLGEGSSQFAFNLGRVSAQDARSMMAKQFGMMPLSQIQSIVTQLSSLSRPLSQSEQRLLNYGISILNGTAGPEWARIQAINDKYNALLNRAITRGSDGSFHLSDVGALSELRTMATLENLLTFSQAHTAPGNRSGFNDDLVARNLIAFFGSQTPDGRVFISNEKIAQLPLAFRNVIATLTGNRDFTSPPQEITPTTAGDGAAPSLTGGLSGSTASN